MRLVPVLSILVLAVGCSAPQPKVTAASRGPMVVFEAGLGDGADIWDKVRLPEGIAQFAWTRAGYGPGADLSISRPWGSDLDGRRTGEEVAGHLAEALTSATARPPYILVGHSIGALYALSFAKAHPDQVAGIVLVDPRLPGFTARCTAAGLRGCKVPPLLLATMSPTEQLELRGVALTEAALADLSALRAIPLTILVAERSGLGEDPRWRPLWTAHARDFAGGFDTARVVGVDSGHYVQNAAPEIVAREIEDMIATGGTF